MEEIKLNFVALDNQYRTFQVFRSRSSTNSQQDPNDYRAKLPVNTSSDSNWESFDLSLNPKNSYEPFDCNYSLNAYLSVYYLYESLKTILAVSDKSKYVYSIPDSKYKEIRFTVSESSNGTTEISVLPHFLESEKKLGFLFQHYFRLPENGKHNRQSQISSFSLDRSGRPNVFIYRDKEAVIEKFLEKKFRPLLESHSIKLQSDFFCLNAKHLRPKSYLVGKDQVSNSQFMGIKKSGPYRKVEQNVKYYFIFSKGTKLLARDIYLGLTGKLFPAQFSGMDSMFQLPINKDSVKHHQLEDFSQSSIDAIGSELEILKEKYCQDKIILIVALPKGFKGVDGVFDAYGYLKYLALSHDVFCQVITEDTFFRKDQLKWSISNIGLQIFCKLGGAPWLVKPAKKDCLILGLGSAHEKINDKVNKFIAYTVCLDSSGDFKSIRPLSSSNNEEDYLKLLRMRLKEILQNEMSQNYSSFVIHLPFKIKRKEIEAIKETVHSIKEQSKCEVIVLKINTSHPYLGFSKHNTRVPYESSLLRLSDNKYLLWAEGLQYGKEVLHKRVSEPLFVHFLEPPNSIDGKMDCLQDVLNLTGANWRGFNSKARPISIHYSKLIADFMKEFSHFEVDDYFEILNTESVAPWFL